MFIDRYLFTKHLEEGENVLFVAHKHWTQFLPKVLNVTFFGFLFPWVFYMGGLKGGFIIGLIFLWMFAALIRLLYDWINWYADVWLFTNMTVIVVEWRGIFSNTSQRLGYDDIEGAGYEIKGFWASVMRFGDVTLQVVSGSHVTMENARRPKEIEMEFMKHKDSYLNDRDMAHSDTLKDLLSKMVVHHMRRK